MFLLTLFISRRYLGGRGKGDLDGTTFAYYCRMRFLERVQLALRNSRRTGRGDENEEDWGKEEERKKRSRKSFSYRPHAAYFFQNVSTCQNVNFFRCHGRPKSPGDYLVHAKLKPLRSQGCKPPGTVKCGGRRC